MNMALWIVQIVLALAFLMFGYTKSFQYVKAMATLPWVSDYSKGFVIFIGLAEILGALGLILPMITGIWTWMTALAAIGLAFIMLLAAIIHYRRNEKQSMLMNFIFLVLTLFVAYGRWMF
jgi:uncharacterized membrane protein YphA (DoxX/SURF4 family)